MNRQTSILRFSLSQRLLNLIVSAVFVGVLSNTLKAREISDDQQEHFEQAFESKQSETRTFESGLKQTLSIRGVKGDVVSKGQIFYAAPDRLLIRFHDPENELVLLNGKKVILQKSGEAPVEQILDGEKAFNFLMLLHFFQDGAKELKRSHCVSMESSHAKLTVFLKPKEEESSLPKIKTILQLPELEPVRLRIVFTKEDSLEYEFLNPKRNRPLPKNLFSENQKEEAP